MGRDLTAPIDDLHAECLAAARQINDQFDALRARLAAHQFTSAPADWTPPRRRR